MRANFKVNYNHMKIARMMINKIKIIRLLISLRYGRKIEIIMRK